MAEKRMFAKSIVLSDVFLDMPMSARCLYFTLGMLADDDGFVGSPRAIMRQCGASQDDLNILLAKRYVLGFDNGVIVIKHWRINNYLQNDRHHPTTYREELATLTVDEKGSYKEIEPNELPYTKCIQNVYADKNREEKNRLDKNSIDQYIEFAAGDSELLQALKEHESMRKKIKKPMTDGAKKRLISELQKYPREDWIPMLNQSTDHCWQGVFPLDNKKTDSKPVDRTFTPTVF